jgi:hypothetical protein
MQIRQLHLQPVKPLASRRAFRAPLTAFTAAEIEHSLLVEYLYAAYSLNPNAVPPGGAAGATNNWRREFVNIAMEEMGHLLSVQNVLRYVGGPLHFDREHFPYRSQLYPFPFVLQRLTKKSLAKYVFAEMHEGVSDDVILAQDREETGQAYYKRETRWPESPFWGRFRRASVVPGSKERRP